MDDAYRCGNVDMRLRYEYDVDRFPELEAPSLLSAVTVVMLLLSLILREREREKSTPSKAKAKAKGSTYLKKNKEPSFHFQYHIKVST